MVGRLVSGILTAVFVPLGVVFTTLGLVLDDEGGFLVIGLAALAVGLVCAGAFNVFMRRAAAERGQRRLRGPAEIVAAELKPYIRIGVYLTYDVTLRIAGSTVTGRVQVVPGQTLEPGGSVEVLYDPADPANFEIPH